METKQSFSPEVVDKFIQRQGRMLRGVKASSPEEAITYFTNPSPKGFETTRGPGIYTSNSTDIILFPLGQREYYMNLQLLL